MSGHPDARASREAWWRDLTGAHWIVFAGASLAWLFDCLDQQVFNLGRDGAVEGLLPGTSRATEYASYTTSFFLMGWALGGLVLGAMGDRFGRARVLTVALLAYSLSTGACAFASSYPAFCACVFTTGVGVGGIFGLAVALVADTVTDRARAPALGLLQSLSALGNGLAGVLGMGIGVLAAAGRLPFGLKTWQGMFAAGALPALASALLLLRIPEPDKWRRAREAARLRGSSLGSYRALLGDPRWSSRAWAGLWMCCSGIIGLWGLGNFYPAIVRSIVTAHLIGEGLSPAAAAGSKEHWSAIALLCLSAGGFFGMLTFAKVTQTLGRRPAFAIAISLSFLVTQIVFRGLRDFGQIYWMIPLMGFGQFSVFAVYAIYLPELFPTGLRSTGTSFCYNFGRLAAASAPFTLGRLTKRLGGDIEGFRTAGLWVSLVLLTGLLALLFLPETKDRPLPED